MTRVLMTVPRATEVVSGSAVTHSRGGGEMEGGMRHRQKETGEGRERVRARSDREAHALAHGWTPNPTWPSRKKC